MTLHAVCRLGHFGRHFLAKLTMELPWELVGREDEETCFARALRMRRSIWQIRVDSEGTEELSVRSRQI